MARPRRSSSHVTIADVARRAGVSTGAVSYALNGRPGVSEATRARVPQVADEMGWAQSDTLMSTALFRFKGPFGAQWELFAATIVLAFVLLQEWIYRGLTAGAVQ